MTGEKLEKIYNNLLKLVDEPVKLHREIEYWNRKEPVMMEMILDGVFIKRRDKSDTMQYCSFKERYCIGTKPIKKNENAE